MGPAVRRQLLTLGQRPESSEFLRNSSWRLRIGKRLAMAARILPPRIDDIDGDPVIARAHLSHEWMRFRNVTMSCCPLMTGPFGCAFLPITLPLYQALGRSYRVEEAASWQLVLTRRALWLQYRQYLFGCFCIENRIKRIALDSIDAISVVSEGCADCLSWSEGPGAPWRLRIHTTTICAEDGNTVTIEMHCVRQPDEFRFKILEAQRRLINGSAGAAAKGSDTPGPATSDSLPAEVRPPFPACAAAKAQPSARLPSAPKSVSLAAQDFAL